MLHPKVNSECKIKFIEKSNFEDGNCINNNMGMDCSSKVRPAAAIAEDVGFDFQLCPQFFDSFRYSVLLLL